MNWKLLAIRKEPYDNGKRAASRLRQGPSHTLWLLSGLVALAFVGAGGAKLAGGAAMVEEFDKVGLGQWFRYFMYFTGFLEVAAAIGLLIPRYAFYAAVLLAIVMVGAIIAHLAVLGGSPAAAVVLFVLSGIIAYLRKRQNINQQRTRT